MSKNATFFSILLPFAAFLFSPSLEAAMSSRELCAHADREYQLGMEMLNSAPGQSARHFQGAKIRYIQALEEGGASAALHYNLANTCVRLGELPDAIAGYRRALCYAPNDADIRANLQYARKLRKDHFQPYAPSPVLKKLFFWHYGLPFGTRLHIAVAVSALFWFCASLALWHWQRRTLRASVALLALCTLTAWGSIAVSCRQAATERHAVILAEEVIPRQGDAESYAAAFDLPLHAGTEVDILRVRGKWTEIRLPNGLPGWLPADALLEI